MDAVKTDKIMKILAKAERAGTPEEAETFFAKAQELMVKWSIDEAMLRAAKPAGSSRIEVKTRKIQFNKSKIWRNHANLLWAICSANEVPAVLTDYKSAGSKPYMTLVGFEEDLDMVEMLYTSMLIQCSRERNRLVPDEIKSNESLRGPWFRSFIDAYAARIKARLIDNKRFSEQAAKAEYGNSLLPALVEKKSVVDAEFKKLFPNLKYAKASKARWSAEGANRGREAADRADIGSKRIGGDGPKSLGR